MKSAIDWIQTVSFFMVGSLALVLILILSVMAVEKFMIRKRKWKRKWKKKNRS